MDVRDVLPRDAIPSVDDPTFDPGYIGADGDPVVVLEPGAGADPPRAYPTRILDYHEVVNDVLDGRPVAVTWCPLCGSAVVYDRRVGGHTPEFGVSGKLADDDLVLYDRVTGSEFKQSLGEAIAGPLDGERLAVVPARTTTYGGFRADHPDGVVLQPPDTPSEAASDDDSPAPVDYDDTPYRAYEAADGFGLEVHRGTGTGRSWERTDLGPKAVVLGLVVDGEPRGYPLGRVRSAGGVVTDRLGGESVLVVAGADGIHAYADPGHDWSLVDGRLRAAGTTWDPGTGRAADGRGLERLPARRLFAFAWQDDHGPDAFWRP